MKCSACGGKGVDLYPDPNYTGMTKVCPICGGAGAVRSREYHLEQELGSVNMQEVRGRLVPEVDTEPTVPPKVLCTKWDASFTICKDWRWWGRCCHPSSAQDGASGG